MPRPKPTSIDEYIARFPKETQKVLKLIRATIRKAAPRAEETISYAIPAYKLDGKALIYFAAFTNHVSVYPAPRGKDEFRDELAKYKGVKGTVQFPLDKPVPNDLITRIVKFRAKENLEKALAKKGRK